MTEDTKPVLCGNCHIPLDGGVERNGETWGVCSRCGQTDPMEKVMREAAEHGIDQAMRGMFKGLSGGGMSIKSPQQRRYRWIVGD